MFPMRVVSDVDLPRLIPMDLLTEVILLSSMGTPNSYYSQTQRTRGDNSYVHTYIFDP